MSSFDSSVNSSTTPSKRYPYARPRRATSRPTPKTALVGESGARFPLQAKKRGHNYSLGAQQIPRIVTTAKPANQTDDIAHQESITSMPSAVDPAGQAPFVQSTAYIPVRLPKVTIPSVDPRAFCYGRLVHVPPAYVTSQIRVMSPSMLRSATMYRPTPPQSNNIASPNTAGNAGTPSTSNIMDILPSDTLRFEIPADVVCDDATPSLYRLEPTHCLAVRPRLRADGETSKTGGVFGSTASSSEEVGRMIPIHHMVYASQCANFPRPVDYAPEGTRSPLVSPGSATGSFLSSTSPVIESTSDYPSLTDHVDRPQILDEASTPTASARSPLPSIVEEASTPPARHHSEMQDETTPIALPRSPHTNLPEMSSASFTSMQLDDSERIHSQPFPLAQVVDLPMVHVTVPHPSGMNLVHGWLYNPSPPVLLAILLDLPRPDIAVPVMPPVSERLAALPVPAVLERMRKIHKLWSNVVALGISDPVLWKVMDRAWDTLVAAVKRGGGEAVHEVPLGQYGQDEEGMGVHSEVVRKFSMATIRDPRSRAGSGDESTS